jgi:acyl dehydratase
MVREVQDVQSFRELVGQDLGTSEWHTVTQLHVDAFARATEDYEDLHVDPGSAATVPFGGTVAHGLYTLSLGPKLFEQILIVKKFRLGLNYGYDRVRFTSPVIPRCRLRLVAHLEAAEPIDGGGLKLRIRQTFEIEGQEKPACVAIWAVAYYD